MKKVLVVEVGSREIGLNAFGDLDQENPKLVGQAVAHSFEKALRQLEEEIGSIPLMEWESYCVTHQDLKTQAEGFNRQISYQKVMDPQEAVAKVAHLLLEEVGDALLINENEDLTWICLAQKGRPLLWNEIQKVKQEAEILPRKTDQKTFTSEQELADQMALTASTLKDAVLELCRSRDLTGLRWVVGTGEGLTNVPRGMEIIKESLADCEGISFPEEGYPVLIDQYNILTPAGAFVNTYRAGAWQLLLESLGVDS